MYICTVILFLAIDVDIIEDLVLVAARHTTLESVTVNPTVNGVIF